MRLRSMIQTAAVTLVFALLSGSAPLAQQDQPRTPQETSFIKPASADTVSLNVAVTDQEGLAITGLKKEGFRVYENGVEQLVTSFSAEDSPISWGLVLDRSDMMRKTMDDVYHSAFHVISERADRDEAFLVAFDDQVEMVSDFTSDYAQLLGALRRVRPGRHAALYDAVAFAMDHMRQAKNRTKALFVITDGGDDGSKITFRQLLERASREGILIYTVGLVDYTVGHADLLSSRPPRGKGGRWQGELKTLAEATGAHAHFPNDMLQCEEAMKAMVEEVGRQYRLEYDSNNPARDGKWRKIKVVVAAEGQNEAARVVRTRIGYYAPTRER
ncbi:MAG: VWA domain-containing protein [Acidobacteriota bacterium]